MIPLKFPPDLPVNLMVTHTAQAGRLGYASLFAISHHQFVSSLTVNITRIEPLDRPVKYESGLRPGSRSTILREMEPLLKMIYLLNYPHISPNESLRKPRQSCKSLAHYIVCVEYLILVEELDLNVLPP